MVALVTDIYNMVSNDIGLDFLGRLLLRNYGLVVIQCGNPNYGKQDTFSRSIFKLRIPRLNRPRNEVIILNLSIL
jgi:hypothetical protein